MNDNTSRRPVLRNAVVGSAVTVLLALIGAPTAMGMTAPEPGSDPTAVTDAAPPPTPHCFMGRHDWNFDLAGPPPCQA